MDDNSYAQLIDDFEKGLLVLEGESLTDYIKRMGGVDYDAKANGGVIGYADGGLMSPEEYFKGKEKYMKEEQIENMRREYNEYLYKEKNGPRDEAANGGIMGRVGFALGGMRTQDLSSVYDSSSVLQDKYATRQDYLDLFDQNTTTTTTPTTSTTTTTDLIEQAPAAMLPPRVNPLIIPQGGDSGSGTPPGPNGGITAGINLDYGYTSPGGNLDADGNFYNIDDIAEGSVADEDYTLGMRAKDAYSGIVNSPFVKYNPFNPMFMFNLAKAGTQKAKDFALEIKAKKDKEIADAAQVAKDKLAAARAAIARNEYGGEIQYGDGQSAGMGFGGGRTDPTDKS